MTSLPENKDLKGLFNFDYNLKNQKKDRKLDPSQVTLIKEKIASSFDISSETVGHALGDLFRRGAANNNTPDTLTSDIFCPDTTNTVSITKFDVKRAMEICMPLGGTLRNLAEAMAEDMITTATNYLKIVPNSNVDFSGDLAKKIDAKLKAKNETPLTQIERICCASYCQNLENLDKIANSTRLKKLLQEDLNERISKRSKKPSKGKNKKSSKKIKKDSKKNK